MKIIIEIKNFTFWYNRFNTKDKIYTSPSLFAIFHRQKRLHFNISAYEVKLKNK